VGIGPRVGFITGAAARFARASSISAGVVPNVAGRARVACIVAGVVNRLVRWVSCGFLAGIGARLARVARFITGAVARFARASSIGAAGVIPNLAGRARIAWRAAGVVNRFVGCCYGVAWSVKGFVPGTVAMVTGGGKARAGFVAVVVRVARRVVAALMAE
jgi:hypothetical protein